MQMTLEVRTLGERIKLLRTLHDETLRDLATAVTTLGYPTNKDELSRIENGTKSEDKVDPVLVLRIAQHYEERVGNLSPEIAERLEEIATAAQNWKMLTAA